MRLLGYARMSSNTQLLDTQIKRSKEPCIKESRIFCNKATGSDLNR